MRALLVLNNSPELVLSPIHSDHRIETILLDSITPYTGCDLLRHRATEPGRKLFPSLPVLNAVAAVPPIARVFRACVSCQSLRRMRTICLA